MEPDIRKVCGKRDISDVFWPCNQYKVGYILVMSLCKYLHREGMRMQTDYTSPSRTKMEH